MIRHLDLHALVAGAMLAPGAWLVFRPGGPVGGIGPLPGWALALALVSAALLPMILTRTADLRRSGHPWGGYLAANLPLSALLGGAAAWAAHVA